MTDQPEYPVPIASGEDIADFVARYGKPYDAETDAYEREAFVADIREGKNDPIYNAHSYHTKVPPRAIIPYILHYTEPGDIVLDPFCGSGMTGVAALLCEEPPPDILASVPGAKKGARRAILNDLSPAACHIAYNYCTPVDAEVLKAEFERIKAAVKEEFDWLYGTEHYEPAVGIYEPTSPEVASRLKNPPENASAFIPLPDEERTWQLIDRAEVERRMGAEALAKQPLPNGVDRFIAIPASIQYMIWSDVYKCQGMVTVEEPTGKINRTTGKPAVKRVRRPRGCGAKIVLWSDAVDHSTGSVSETFPCPKCGVRWKKVQIERAATVPVLTSYRYPGLRAKNGSKRRSIEIVEMQADRATVPAEVVRINEISAQQVPWPVPVESINTKGPQYNRNALSARNIRLLSDFYTTRNLRALACLWHYARNASDPMRRYLLFCLTSTFGHVERTTRYKFKKGGNSSLSGQLYFPSFPVEDNVLRQLTSKIKQLIRALQSLRLAARHPQAIRIACGHAGRMQGMKDRSVDYIFADPPFGSNIYYSEVNWLYECWLGARTDDSNEAVVHRKNDRGTKSIDDYSRLMTQAFNEMFRVLKPSRFATIEFNNNDGRVFEVIKAAARGAGFAIENMVFLDKVQKTFKQLKGDKGQEDVVGHDVIFNLRKPMPAMVGDLADGVAPSVASEERAPSLEHIVRGAVRQHLFSLKDRIAKDPKTYSDEHRTTPFLNTVLMNALIPQGVNVERLNLPYIERVCGRYFRKVDNRWYLPDEAAAQQNIDGARGLLFRAPIEDVEIRDEASALAWLRGQLNNGGMRIGELRPHWMRATVKLTGDLSTRLEQFLREHFWLDRQTHRWRMPTPDELAQMDDTEQRRARHEAERFLAGNSRRPPSDAVLLEWIDHLYRSATRLEEEAAGLTENGRAAELPEVAKTLYNMMVRLIAGVLKEHVEEPRLALAQRQCRIARAKLAAQVERDEALRDEALAADDDRPLFASIDADD